MASRTEQVQTPDGSFGLQVWLPPAGRGPGVLVAQEIFGVSDYIEAAAEDLAALGYVVAAPDLFWRLRPGIRLAHDEAGIAEALETGNRFDFAQGVVDAVAAYQVLAGLPEVTGGMGLVGFCLGGSIVYFMATQLKPDAVVSFYGSGVPDHLHQFSKITSPIQFHFGGSDQFIARDDVAKVEEAVAGHPSAEIHVEEQAGHAFHNRKAPVFYNPEPASRAWARTEHFLAKHLPVGSDATAGR
jgi:carboxymethylenebutenolidase